MARYPQLVESAWNVVNSTLRDWQKEPYRWFSERDVQLEIASRLKTVFNLMGTDSVNGKLDWAHPDHGPRQQWARVACEPHVSYTFSDGEVYRCHPDIVIWDDLPSADWTPAKGENFPILWVCELKLTARPSTWDLEKLKYLVSQNHVQYGCWVKIRREPTHAGAGIDWKSHGPGNRLWECDARFPKVDRTA